MHPFDHVEFGFERLCFLNGNHTVFTDFLHGISEEFADFGIPVGRNGANLGDFLLDVNFFEFFFRSSTTASTASSTPYLKSIGFMPAVDRLGVLPATDRLGEHGRRSGAIAGLISGLGCDFSHHLSTHILVLVFELDFFGDGHAVFGERGAPSE